MTKPVRLFWWRGTPNFGDALSQEIVRFVSGREVIWSEAEKSELFAIGSLLSLIKHSPSTRSDSPWIWGSGNLGPILPSFLNRVKFAAVRGPLTRASILYHCNIIGDPALLCPLAFGETIKPSGKIGVVLHHTQCDTVNIPERKDFQIIDPRNNRPFDVVKKIAECQFILSSSLHGLIVADAFGVPNKWINPRGIHQYSYFKFFDYFFSVGRKLSTPVQFEEMKDGNFIDKSSVAKREKVKKIQNRLIEAFPKELSMY